MPFIRGARGVYKALRTGAATSGLVATQEAIRYPFDPLATPQEAFMNIGTAFAIGTSLQAAISIPKTRRARATREAEEEINNLKAAIDPDYKPKGKAVKKSKTASENSNKRFKYCRQYFYKLMAIQCCNNSYEKSFTRQKYS